MNSTLNQSSFDSDCDQMVSTESIPRLSTSAYETPDFGSGAKRQKVKEDDKKVKGGDGDVLVETVDDDADEIEDGDDEDDFMEAKQYTPKVTIWESCSEDDEGFQRYLSKVIDSEGFDLDEDPLDEYPFTGFTVCRVNFDHPDHAHHKEFVAKCIKTAIQQQHEPVCHWLIVLLFMISFHSNFPHAITTLYSSILQLTYVKTLTANYAVEVGYIYFITFMAKENSSSEVKTYQTEVSHDLWGGMVVNKFREKAQ
ncbi:unnamed protein product [Linum tenue]|uniref:Uncharacterized protein n=1 Tax=Linum tenue TaxID=586396 RepID=A0AAV0PU93_9ROSI|nr:unnamed protein product [Linum tenue]